MEGIYIKEDDSVIKKLEKTAKKLKKNKGTREVNEKRLLKEKSKLQKTFSIIFDTICIAFVIICSLLCFSNINCRFQNIPPSFAGYSAMRVVSGSMVKSGINIGDTVMVSSVDPKTLKENDIIAFYVYSKNYSSFDINACSKVNTSKNSTRKALSFSKFFGIQSKEIQSAAKAGSKLVLHHIKYVLEDEKGTLWFKTYGSSNSSEDSWFISEEMIVGSLDKSNFSQFLALFLANMTSSWGLILCILIPLVLVSFIIISECITDVSMVLLECDVVDGKRLLTDEICVKNNIGFSMSEKTKHKVLAAAPQEKKLEYVSLLWNVPPNSIKKYYLRKKFVLKPYEELVKLEKECKERLMHGADDLEVSKYYLQEQAKILEKQNRYKNMLKEIKNKN